MGWALVGSLPVAAGAQSPVPTFTPSASDNQASTATTATAQLGGTPTVDIISLRPIGPGTPLRYGNVIPGSERVQLDGVDLTAGDDYGMDYATGVVYLKRAQKLGQTLTVTYRYNAQPDPSAPSRFQSFSTMKYSLMPGGLTAMMGLGMVDRTADGRVMSGNVFGWNNTFKFGQSGSLNGVYIYGNRAQARETAGLRLDSNPTQPTGPAPAPGADGAGGSRFILQNFSSKLMGGDASFDYQDISKNFSAFSAVGDAGYDDKTVKQFQAERGLTRMGMNLNNLKFGSLGFSTGFKSVEDDGHRIDWRSYGVQQGGLKLNFNSEQVDSRFTRFTDLSEADRAQLQREVGMSRQNWSGEFAQKMGKLGFTGVAIRDDLTGLTIHRDDYTLDTSKLKFDFGQQSVDTGFTRMDGLMDPEKAMYGAEAGLHRQWMSLQSSLFGAQAPLSFQQTVVGSATGKYVATDFDMKAKTWDFQHIERNAGSTFASLSAMSPTEMNANIKAISAMYDPTLPVNPADSAGFVLGAGIDRDFTGLRAQPFKNWNFAITSLQLKGLTDKGRVDTLALSNTRFNFSYRAQNLGKAFNDQASMMSFEQQRLGMLPGLSRTDLGFNAKLSGSKVLNFQRMTADDPNGAVNRTTVEFSDKKIDVQLASREVGPQFAGSTLLVDNPTEQALMASLQGFKERDAAVKWQLLPTMNFNASIQSAIDDASHEARDSDNVAWNWAPNKTVQLGFTSQQVKQAGSASTLFESMTQQISLSKDFGRYGKFAFMDERNRQVGTPQGTLAAMTTVLVDPNFHEQYFSYDAKINPTTEVKTEQTFTRFDDGTNEQVNANTISTALTKRVGVSVTNVDVDRSGNQTDEQHRNYGFWYDLGNGLRVSYGYARQLSNDPNADTTSNSLQVGKNAGLVTPDASGNVQASTVAGLNVAGGYGTNQWDQQNRTQSFSKVAISTAKPLHFGPLTDVHLNMAMDSAADYETWVRDNETFSISAKLGANAVGYDYNSQIAATDLHGIDRTFHLTTDPNQKNLLSASIFYKIRTLPDQQQVMIRDYTLTFRPTNRIEVTNKLQTNPEVAQSNVLLGSVPQASRSNKWQVDFKSTKDTSFGANWQELHDESTDARSTTGGLTMKLFQTSGSPVNLFYGMEETEGNVPRHFMQRYSLQFDQKPGPNQVFSLFLGNLNYEHNLQVGELHDNWTVRLNYQYKF